MNKPTPEEIAEYRSLVDQMLTLKYGTSEYNDVRARLDELDESWKRRVATPVPHGFEPVWHYPGCDDIPEQRQDVVALTATSLHFELPDLPVLPLRLYGEIDHAGWDIPTRYVIDAKGVCFMDDGHGNALSEVTLEQLERECEDDANINRIRKALGRKPKLPAWMRTALDAGWTPPGSFDASEYE